MNNKKKLIISWAYWKIPFSILFLPMGQKNPIGVCISQEKEWQHGCGRWALKLALHILSRCPSAHYPSVQVSQLPCVPVSQSSSDLVSRCSWCPSVPVTWGWRRNAQEGMEKRTMGGTEKRTFFVTNTRMDTHIRTEVLIEVVPT